MNGLPSCHFSRSGLQSSSTDGRQYAALSLMNEPLFLSPADNKLVGALVVARLVAACRLAPRGHRMPSAGSFAFTAAVRMVHRVHGHAAVHRFLAQPDDAPGLAYVHVLVLHITNLP